ncbi:translation initiation factor eIF 4e-like domain-containing protein [Dipodascopsis tothii]|uniref:translation initiation factor eIF 4e-like domain-containing protein n=1 Tax=Dipodascopsis tothii TaxID=44089 RepID=UPI0034CFFF15
MADISTDTLAKEISEKLTVDEPAGEVAVEAVEVEAVEVEAVDSTDSAESTEKGEKTVFDSPVDFTVIHPLMHTWTLWYTKPPQQGVKQDWNDMLKEVATFDTVEQFWGVYNNIAKASDLALKADYHLFKKGIRPEWEDSQNENGGRWSFQCKDKRSYNIDMLWLHTMLGAIGETVEQESDDEVMGVVVNVRKALFRISVWTRTHNNEQTLLDIGRRFKMLLQLHGNDLVEFTSHREASISGSSRAKARMTA